MSKIIVSYRRSDSAAITGRIYDRLVDRYGEELVFMDVDRIPFGTDFRHHIQGALRDADILLAVIGPTWLGKSPDGGSRIQDEADPVRVEIETALRQGLTVIPVLVDNAPMPGAADLPESIRDFAYINAAPIDVGRDFRQHMERLTRSIDGIVGADKAAMEVVLARGYPDAPKASSWSARRLAVIVGSLAVAGIGAIIAVNLSSERLAQNQMSERAKQAAEERRPTPSPPTTAPDAPVRAPQPKAEPPAQPKAQPTYRVPPNVSGGVQNMRSGPGLKYPIVVAVPAGATGITLGVCRAAEDNTRPWCAAKWREHSGWISSCCIVDEKTGAPPKVD